MLMKEYQITNEMFATVIEAVKTPAIIFRLHPACAFGNGGIGTNERFSRTLKSSNSKMLGLKTEDGYSGLSRVKWRLSA